MLQYEFHSIDNPKMPFIFHHDTIDREYFVFNWHENIEILYVTEGEGFIKTSNEQYSAEKGDIFVINSYSPHNGNSNSNLKYFCFIIDNEFCLFNGFDTNKYLYQTKINDKKASEFIENIINELNEKSSLQECAVKTNVLNLLLYITKNYCLENTNTPRHTKNADIIKTAIGYIRSHFNERLTVEQIADEVGLSKYYFSREFKRLTGLTVVTYMNYVKCENAKKLLKTDKYSVNDVCELCGFDNLSYFAKTFKKFMGTTPSGYNWYLLGATPVCFLKSLENS